jgi:glycosyltransferase involved in cell wall biosynthesis
LRGVLWGRKLFEVVETASPDAGHFVRRSLGPFAAAVLPRSYRGLAFADAASILLVKSSQLFDAEWYCREAGINSERTDPAKHYLTIGAGRGLNPSREFDGAWYLQRYDDVRRSGSNPLVHYLRCGRLEGRQPRAGLARAVKPSWKSIQRSVRRWRPPAGAAPGVNLIGPVDRLTGLGYSARGYIDSLKSAEVTTNVIPQREGFLHQHHGDFQFQSGSRQPINLFHLNLDFLTKKRLQDAEKFKNLLATDCYNIAIPYWELAVLAPEWVETIGYFDEIWGATSFIAQAVGSASSRPARVVRPAVEPRLPLGKLHRRDFGLPDSSFVFCYVADAASVLGRKNPLGFLQAYMEEFDRNEDVRCLLKLYLHDSHRDGLREISSVIQGRPDILLFTAALSDDAMPDLYAAIDCYVSPHRSEGLGLTMIEAMLAKKPVIATNYGGSVDFVTSQTGLPVDYRFVEVGPNNFPYPAHGVWADPLVPSLRSAMRWAFDNRGSLESIANRGYDSVRTMFAREQTGRDIRAEIERIWAQ